MFVRTEGSTFRTLDFATMQDLLRCASHHWLPGVYQVFDVTTPWGGGESKGRELSVQVGRGFAQAWTVEGRAAGTIVDVYSWSRVMPSAEPLPVGNGWKPHRV